VKPYVDIADDECSN